MCRALAASVTVVLMFLLTPGLVAQPGGALKLGEKFEGEIKVKRGNSFYAEIPIILKAGQDLTVSCTVVGKGRGVTVILRDPNGQEIGDNHAGVKSVQYTYQEVPSSGKYTIVLASSFAGPFTLRATVPGDASEVKALEKRAAELTRELEDVYSKLRALKAGGKSTPKNLIEKK